MQDMPSCWGPWKSIRLRTNAMYLECTGGQIIAIPRGRNIGFACIKRQRVHWILSNISKMEINQFFFCQFSEHFVIFFPIYDLEVASLERWKLIILTSCDHINHLFGMYLKVYLYPVHEGKAQNWVNWHWWWCLRFGGSSSTPGEGIRVLGICVCSGGVKFKCVSSSPSMSNLPHHLLSISLRKRRGKI